MRPVDSVDAFMERLVHPLKPAMEAVRSTILGASPRIAEGIKWNAPSFYVRETGQFFATVNVCARGMAPPCVLVILHQDAKVRDDITRGLTISDPYQLLEWLATVRCAARFYDVKQVRARKTAFLHIVRQWIALM